MIVREVHTVLGACISAVNDGRIAEADVVFEVGTDGTQRVDVTVRNEVKSYAPTTIIREHDGGEPMS